MARPSSEKRAQDAVGGFSTAKKNLVIQYEGKEKSADDIYSLIKGDLRARGMADMEVEKVDAYVKPQDRAIYYVINGEINGQLEF